MMIMMATIEREFANEWRNTVWYEKIFLKLICKEDGKLHNFNTANVTFQMFLQYPAIQNEKCKLYLQNVPIDYILEHSAIRNNMHRVCDHPELRIEHILPHPKSTWDWHTLSKNMNIPFADIAKNKHLCWNWKEISERCDLQIDFVVKNPHLDWNWDKIGEHPNLTITHIKKYKNISTKNKWYVSQYFWFNVCQNPNIPITDILANYGVSGCIPYHPYINDDLAKRNDVTFEIIISYPYILWDWKEVGRHKNITMEHIENNLQVGRDYMYFIPAFVKQPLGVPCIVWDWSAISCNPNLTIGFVLKHCYEKWDWKSVTNNQNIKFADIVKYKDVLPLCEDVIAYRKKLDNIDADLSNVNGMIAQRYTRLCNCEKCRCPYFATGRNWKSIFECPNMRINDMLPLLYSHSNYTLLFSRSLYYIRQHVFEMDMLDYVEQKTKWLLVALMYENLQEYAITDGNNFMKMEHILFNPIIAKMVAMC